MPRSSFTRVDVDHGDENGVRFARITDRAEEREMDAGGSVGDDDVDFALETAAVPRRPETAMQSSVAPRCDQRRHQDLVATFRAVE